MQILVVVEVIVYDIKQRFTGHGFVVKSIYNKSVVPKAQARAFIIGDIYIITPKGNLVNIPERV